LGGRDINCWFSPFGEGIVSYGIFIYNRWGEQVFTSKNMDVKLDRMIDSDKVSANGYYSYIINMVDEMDVALTLKGNLLLQK